MNGMIERVAEAICRSEGWIGMNSRPRDQRGLYLKKARAAIEAMRDPRDEIEITPEMIKEGVEELRYLTTDCISPTSPSLTEAVESIYRAMARAALSAW